MDSGVFSIYLFVGGRLYRMTRLSPWLPWETWQASNNIVGGLEFLVKLSLLLSCEDLKIPACLHTPKARAEKGCLMIAGRSLARLESSRKKKA